MRSSYGARHLLRDFIASVVVFLVAVPLCLGIALASGAPPISGLIAGIVGGIVVGILSGSHTSVSGPAAGLTAVVFSQITTLGSFDIFLLAVVLAGVIQLLFGIFRMGIIAHFVPSSVIKGLLAAIGLIIILKQLPHLVGRDNDPEGDMGFVQSDGKNTFTEIIAAFSDPHRGAMIIGLCSLAFLIIWERISVLRNSLVPAPLIVVLFGIAMVSYFQGLDRPFQIDADHLVQVPVFSSIEQAWNELAFPRFDMILHASVWIAAITLALVASLETLLNLEAVDKLDPKRRSSPPNRELFAQGCGNICSGLLGGLPVTSVIVRSSVNINAKAESKLSTIIHGSLLLICVALMPKYLNQIPLASLAAILIITGWKLASWRIAMQMYRKGGDMFYPFIVTVLAILLTDLLQGILIGLGVSIAYILRSNFRKPLRRVREKHIGGEVLHIELSDQVSFLNRASLAQVLEEIPPGGHVLIDASSTDYIDPDIVALIQTYEKETAPARGIQVSLRGFRGKYAMADRILFADYSSRELRDQMTPDQVLQLLREGNDRFVNNEQLETRDLYRQRSATAMGQSPMAAILSCIDSRMASELIFDLGLGDAFTARVAGNVVDRKLLGSLEFACSVAGAKLLLVLGHSKCGAVNAAVDLSCHNSCAADATGCENLDSVVDEIRQAINSHDLQDYHNWTAEQKSEFVDQVARANVQRTINEIRSRSRCLRELEAQGRIKIVSGFYDVNTGRVHFDVPTGPVERLQPELVA